MNWFKRKTTEELRAEVRELETKDKARREFEALQAKRAKLAEKNTTTGKIKAFAARAGENLAKAGKRETSGKTSTSGLGFGSPLLDDAKNSRSSGSPLFDSYAGKRGQRRQGLDPFR